MTNLIHIFLVSTLHIRIAGWGWSLLRPILCENGERAGPSPSCWRPVKRNRTNGVTETWLWTIAGSHPSCFSDPDLKLHSRNGVGSLFSHRREPILPPFRLVCAPFYTSPARPVGARPNRNGHPTRSAHVFAEMNYLTVGPDVAGCALTAATVSPENARSFV